MALPERLQGKQSSQEGQLSVTWRGWWARRGYVDGVLWISASVEGF